MTEAKSEKKWSILEMSIRISLICLFAVVFFTAAAQVQPSKKVLITYYSQTSSTKEMAMEVARGVKTVKNVECMLKSIEETKTADLLMADAIILGSPVHNANPSPEILDFIRKWPFENQPLKDKLGAVFVTAGGISAGEELVQVNLLHAMMVYGMVVMGGEEWNASFGASAVTNEAPFDTRVSKKIDPLFLKKGFGLGKRVGEWVIRIKK
jgi:NAD(P)H dehydrogenase (quinone)